MHLRSQGPACYIQTTIVYQIFTGNRGVAGSGSHFDGCLLKGRDSARSCSSSGTTFPSFSSSHSSICRWAAVDTEVTATRGPTSGGANIAHDWREELA